MAIYRREPTSEDLEIFCIVSGSADKCVLDIVILAKCTKSYIQPSNSQCFEQSAFIYGRLIGMQSAKFDNVPFTYANSFNAFLSKYLVMFYDEHKMNRNKSYPMFVMFK